MTQKKPSANKLREETLRRIGRNVVNFQRLELALKSLIPALSVSGAPHELVAERDRRARELESRTLGPVVQAFHAELYGPPFPNRKQTDPRYLSISFAMRIESDGAQELKSLLSLVKERNRLIHHDLGLVDLDSLEACDRLCAQLDEQNERICRYLSWLGTIDNMRTEAANVFLKLLESEEFRADFFGGQTPSTIEGFTREL